MGEKYLTKEELKEHGKFFKKKAEEMEAVLGKCKKNPKACKTEDLKKVVDILDEAYDKYEAGFAKRTEEITHHKIGSPLFAINNARFMLQIAEAKNGVLDPELHVPPLLGDINRLKLCADSLMNPEKFRPVEIRELAKKFKARQKGTKITVGELPKATTRGIDLDQILDVMDEVVINAKRHGKATKIHLDAEIVQNKFVNVSIWNNGKELPERKGVIGISIQDKEAQDRVFKELKKRVGGFGTKYSKNVLKAHEGRFTLENKRKGEHRVRAVLSFPLKK